MITLRFLPNAGEIQVDAHDHPLAKFVLGEVVEVKTHDQVATQNAIRTAASMLKKVCDAYDGCAVDLQPPAELSTPSAADKASAAYTLAGNASDTAGAAYAMVSTVGEEGEEGAA